MPLVIAMTQAGVVRTSNAVAAAMAWRKGSLVELARDHASGSVGGEYFLSAAGRGMRGNVVAFDTTLTDATQAGAVVVGTIR